MVGIIEFINTQGTLTDEARLRLKDEVKNIEGWLDVKLKNGFCSRWFVIELALHSLARWYDVHAIFDEIGGLEGTNAAPSLTKPASKFRKAPLKGLWHKHHFQTGFMMRNLALETGRDGVMERICEPHIGKMMSEVIDQISYEMVIGAYEQRARARRMTGEWIVFEKIADRNYYLTLGEHGEDEHVRARVDAYKEFDMQAVREAADHPR